VAILIGGKSTRFGSDKGLYEFQHRPLISYQLDTLSQVNSDIFLVAYSAKQVQEYISKIDLNKIMAFLIDDIEIAHERNLHTPLRGLYTTFKELKELDYKKVLTLACDTPLIQQNVIELIIEQSKDYDCCIPKWDNGFLEPLFAIYPIKKSYYKAKKNLKTGNLKLTSLLSSEWKINYLSIQNSIKKLDNNLRDKNSRLINKEFKYDTKFLEKHMSKSRARKL